MEKATIIFKNGTQIEAEVNGDCYITEDVVEFPEDLSIVTIDNGTVLHNVRVIEPYSVDDRYWFAFEEMTEDEIWKAEIEDALCELSMSE